MPNPVISGQANPSQIEGLNNLRTQVGQSNGAPTYNTSSNSKTYFMAFDGTNNNRDKPSFGPETNVSLLDKQAQKSLLSDGSGDRNYYPGVGTTGPLQLLDAGSGASMKFTAREATADFQEWARQQYEANPNVEINLAGVSASRGTITHTLTLNNIYNEGVGKRGSEIWSSDENGKPIVTGYSEHWQQPKSDNLGTHLMLDRVAGPMNAAGAEGVLLPPAAGLRVVNIRALDEHRAEFASESLRNPDGTIDSSFTEIGVVGAHSNILGCYENNGIADHVLDAG